ACYLRKGIALAQSGIRNLKFGLRGRRLNRSAVGDDPQHHSYVGDDLQVVPRAAVGDDPQHHSYVGDDLQVVPCAAVVFAVLVASVSTTAHAQTINDTITTIPGIRVGHYTLAERPTGCTAILADDGAVAGIAQRGAAPGT